MSEDRRCVIYARSSLSTLDLTTQYDKCREFANEANLKPVSKFGDNLSGYAIPLLGRKGLVALMHYVQVNKISGLVALNVARISRSILQGVYLLHWLRNSGVLVYDVEYLSQSIHLSPSFGWEYQLALYERLLEGEHYYHTHIKDGPAQVADHGLFTGRTTPLGYKAAGQLPTKLIRDKATEMIVQDIFRLCLKHKGQMIGKKDSVNYSELYRLVSADEEWGKVVSELRKAGARKGLSDGKSLQSMLQNPIYAGYLEPVEQVQWKKLHDSYINEMEYNSLNPEDKWISVKKPKNKTYANLIRCAGCGKLLYMNPAGKGKTGYVECRNCRKRFTEQEMSELIKNELCHWHIDKDIALFDHLAKRLKMGRFQVVLEKISDVLQDYVDADAVVIDSTALTMPVPDNKELLEAMDEIIKLIDKYHERGYSELAVHWVEALREGSAREMLERFALHFTYDFIEGILTLEHNENIRKLDRPVGPEELDRMLEEIDRMLEERQQTRQSIFAKINALPAMKAILEYDTGYSSGDFWTKFEDMI